MDTSIWSWSIVQTISHVSAKERPRWQDSAHHAFSQILTPVLSNICIKVSEWKSLKTSLCITCSIPHVLLYVLCCYYMYLLTYLHSTYIRAYVFLLCSMNNLEKKPSLPTYLLTSPWEECISNTYYFCGF